MLLIQLHGQAYEFSLSSDRLSKQPDNLDWFTDPVGNGMNVMVLLSSNMYMCKNLALDFRDS